MNRRKLYVLAFGVLVLAGCQERDIIISSSRTISPPSPAQKQAREIYGEAHKHREAGNMAAYIDGLKRASSLYPDNHIIATDLAQGYTAIGDDAKALPYFQLVVDTENRVYSSVETDPVILTMWGECELKVGSAANAEDAFQRACKSARRWSYSKLPEIAFPADPTGLRMKAHFAAGIKYYGTGRRDEALKEFQFISDRNPANYDIKLWMAHALEARLPYRCDEALKLYREIAASGRGETAKKAREAKDRLEYYWKMRGTWDPFDPKTDERLKYNPATKRYEKA